MTADISIDAGISAIGAAQRQPLRAAEAPSTPASPAAAGVPQAPALPNPRLTVDPSTARVVYEYFSASGSLTNQIPSPQQLDAYRLAAASGKTETG